LPNERRRRRRHLRKERLDRGENARNTTERERSCTETGDLLVSRSAVPADEMHRVGNALAIVEVEIQTVEGLLRVSPGAVRCHAPSLVQPCLGWIARRDSSSL
jgi:GAF domain-containing protein